MLIKLECIEVRIIRLLTKREYLRYKGKGEFMMFSRIFQKVFKGVSTKKSLFLIKVIPRTSLILLLQELATLGNIK